MVTNCGRICLGNKKINFSTVFAGQAGIRQVHDDIWLVTFMDYDLGYPLAQNCYPCSRYILLPMSPGRTK